jgi:segregation and condensation protein B
VNLDVVRELECLFFVADSPMTIDTLVETTGRSANEIVEAVDQLSARLQASSGLQIVRIAGGYQMCTKREYAGLIARLIQPQKQRLGRSALEVLAIVAYNQPITSTDIDLVRGVQSDYAIKTLVERRLIQEIERKQAPGRPILYGTTTHFLHQFNLNDLSELPPLNGVKKLEEVGT